MSSVFTRARAVLVLAAVMVLGLWSAHHQPTVVSADATEIDIVGHIGGASRAVAIQGDYAYVGEGTQLTILDVSSPGAPVVAGKSPILSGVVEGVAVEGNYAYVAIGYEGLVIVDVATPSASTVVGTLGGSGDRYAPKVVVAGQYAYVAAGSDGLWIIDVTNPAAPIEVSTTELDRAALSLDVVGSFAYVASERDLHVVDVTDPEAPVEEGVYRHEGGSTADVAVQGNYAYIVSSGSEELEVVDISDSAAPVGVGSADLPEAYSSGIAITGNHAYIVDFRGGLIVADISDPENPTEIGYLSQRQGDSLGTLAVVVAGEFAYFNDYYGLRIADVSDPSSPATASSYDTVGLPYGLTAAGEYVYVADGYAGLIVIDAADPTHPNRVASNDTPGLAREVVVAGDYAYVADGGGGLQIIDMADPTAPASAGSLGSLGEAMSLDVEGDYAYVTAYSGGFNLRVIDVSDPFNPVQVASLPTPGLSWNIDVVGGYAYVVNANHPGGFVIIDVSNPANPIQVGDYSDDSGGYFSVLSIKVVDDLAYLAAESNFGLRIVNVADPTAPYEVTLYDTPSGSESLVVSGTSVYLTEFSGGLRIIDVTDPALPVELGHIQPPPYARDVAVAGRYAYVTADNGGLYVLKYPADDDDGQSDETEDGAPNNGDGNNDGIPDSQQANVVSLPNSENGSYMTLEAPAGIELVDVQATPNPSPGDAPAGASFPIGFLDFEIEGIAPGEAVAVTIILHGGETVDAYYKYGPEPGDPADHWYEFDDDGTTGAELLGDRVVLHLVDGQRGDADLAADGVIVDPGAPALAPAATATLYVTAAGGRVPGVGAYQNNDILKWDGRAWSLWFDGASEGLPRAADIMAFDVDDDATGSAWLAFRPTAKLPGLGKTQPTQIAYFNGASWSLFFDGTDVGLKTSGERINGLEVLPGNVSPIGAGCQYYLLISTVAGGGVPIGPTNVNFTGEDVLGFCMTSGGANTTGTWHVVFEGQAEGLAKNNNLGLSANNDATTLYFTAKKAFTGDGGLVKPSELFSWSGGTFSGPLWKAKDHGLMQAVDGIDVIGAIP